MSDCERIDEPQRGRAYLVGDSTAYLCPGSVPRAYKCGVSIPELGELVRQIPQDENIHFVILTGARDINSSKSPKQMESELLELKTLILDKFASSDVSVVNPMDIARLAKAYSEDGWHLSPVGYRKLFAGYPLLRLEIIQ